jgi:hypothetical protein
MPALELKSKDGSLIPTYESPDNLSMTGERMQPFNFVNGRKSRIAAVVDAHEQCFSFCGEGRGN